MSINVTEQYSVHSRYIIRFESCMWPQKDVNENVGIFPWLEAHAVKGHFSFR